MRGVKQFQRDLKSYGIEADYKQSKLLLTSINKFINDNYRRLSKEEKLLKKLFER